MRTLIDLPNDQLDRLNRLAATRRTSRAALVRQAVEDFLAAEAKDRRVAAFGLWSGAEDGLAYQERLRAEW